jgi:hypothetical protein
MALEGIRLIYLPHKYKSLAASFVILAQAGIFFYIFVAAGFMPA